MSFDTTKKKAEARGRRLRRMYALKGWTFSVWENLGWHVKLISPSGRWKIYPYYYGGRPDGFSAFFGEPGEIGAEMGWHGRGKTTADAVKSVRENMSGEVLRLRRKLELALLVGDDA